MLSPDDLERLIPAERLRFRSPIPTQSVSSDEFLPATQSAKQREFEARIKQLGTALAKKQGVSRRAFFQGAAGMAAAFVAMNDTFGPLYLVSRAEAQTPEMANARAASLKGQFIMDMHTHFLRDDTRLEGFVRGREAVGKAGWNPALAGKPQTLDDLKFANYFKEIYLDSDTKVALISGSGSEDPRDWFLTNEMKAEARTNVNTKAGSKRLFSHAIFMPGMPGWLDKVERDLELLKPDSFKGYTVGDNTNKHLAKHPWRLDDEKLLYPFYEKLVRASRTQPGLANVCVHKGLFPQTTTDRFPELLPYADVRDVGKAARDWPQLNFIVYHSAFRFTGGAQNTGWEQFEKTGRIDWVTDLAEIPRKFGVKNVYGDLGQIFAQSTVAEPRLCAAMLGQLIQGLGADHVVWGTDAVWTGAPQWQIEALRRLEIPEEMQLKYGFAPLGAADGPVKSAIFGDNSARLYHFTRPQRAALAQDSVSLAKAEYDRSGGGRTNLRYGYVEPAARVG
ncbi:MAG: amidohydrolase family protein [Betaproteobacteria bacterium]|nr:amidohydrolase family protein [Betaproteobacteria bacterium]